MTEFLFYLGSYGPFFGDDSLTVTDPDEGVLDGMAEGPLVTDGAITMGSLALFDTDATHKLSIVWNEDDSAARTLNLLVGGGNRSVTVNEDFVIGDGHAGTLTFSAASKVLTVEDSAVVSQDYSADAMPTFAGVTLPNAGWVGIGAALERLEFYTAGYAAFMGCVVGIGTATPLANEAYNRLTIAATDNTALSFGVENAGTGQAAFVLRRTGGTAARWYEYIPAASTDLRLNYGGTDRFTFGSTGNFDVIAHNAATIGLKLGGTPVTTSAAELNILDGVTGVTAAELSYIGDVTGLIQAQLNAKAPLASPTFTGTVTVPSTNFTVGTQVLTETNLTDLLDGGDTTLHDHDGITENTSARHTQGTDTTLGTMAADIDMDGSFQVVGLQAPAAAGEAIRQTAKITEAKMEAADDHVAAANPHSGHALESVVGTSIGDGLLLDGAVLEASVILQKYHAIDPSADVQSLLGCLDEAAIRTLLDLEAGTDFPANTFTAINALIGAANAAIDLNDQALTSVGAIGCDTITVVANNDVLLSGTGHVTSGSEGFIVGTLTITDGSIDDTDGSIALGATNLTGVGTIGSTGDHTITTGNLVLDSGQGIDFSAHAHAAGMTSELLDDYEEGTWTPVLTFTTPGDLSVGYTYQNGVYTKVGNVVTIHCFIITSSFTHSAAASYVKITGLPFTATSTVVQPTTAFAFSGITAANYTQFTPVVVQATNFVTVYGSAQAQTRIQLTVSHFPTGGTVQLIFTVTLTVD